MRSIDGGVGGEITYLPYLTHPIPAHGGGAGQRQEAAEAAESAAEAAGPAEAAPRAPMVALASSSARSMAPARANIWGRASLSTQADTTAGHPMLPTLRSKCGATTGCTRPAEVKGLIHKANWHVALAHGHWRMTPEAHTGTIRSHQLGVQPREGVRRYRRAGARAWAGSRGGTSSTPPAGRGLRQHTLHAPFCSGAW